MLLFYLTIKAHKPKLSFHPKNLQPESPTTMHSFTFIVFTAMLVLMTAAAPLTSTYSTIYPKLYLVEITTGWRGSS